MRKILLMILGAVSGFLLVFLVIGAIWFFTSPQFGGAHSKQDIERYKTSHNYEKGKFKNLEPTSMDIDFFSGMGLLWKFIVGIEGRDPDFMFPTKMADSTSISDNMDKSKLLWFGHSAFLLQLDGKNILLDPMLGDVPAPHPVLGGKRYRKPLPIEIEQLPKIDLIIISHDHYDHLDYGSIQKLKTKTNYFIVPLGVGAHLRSWGISADKIEELDWWDETHYKGLDLAFAPSRHFSGQGAGDNQKTLWGSWVIKGKNDNIYFSGDGGYGPHFKEIGEKYGPFDFAMMECGQYGDKWAQIHMMPEETAQAAIDIKAKKMMPIHWGAFSLALHTWTDPIERVSKATQELNMPMIAPMIGEYISLKDTTFKSTDWWVKK